MRQRWIINLVLLLVLAGLGLGVRYELSGDGGRQTLAGVDPADLRLIEVEREGEPRIRLERGPDGWRMLEPMAVEADPERLDKLLGVLAAPVERSFPAQGAALGELGLVPARLTLKLDSLSLVFGGLDPLVQRRYVASEGLVHLIEDRFYHLLIAPAIDYVARSPLPAARPPAFATLNGVPLAADSIQQLASLTTERVEPLGADLAGEPLQVKFADGRAQRFLVSEDRRRWSRLDLKLRYVLADPPVLELDPTAVDPTPPEPPPPTTVREEPTGQPVPQGPPGETLDTEMEPESAPESSPEPPWVPPAEPDPADPFAPIPDPDAPAAEGEAPPEVRLSPDGTRGARGYGDPYPDEDGGGGGFGGEPYKDPPQGFGMDPFAPDPTEDPGSAPDQP